MSLKISQNFNSGRLFRKFNVFRNGTNEQVIERTFTLIPSRDPVAVVAILAYADAVEDTNPELANDLRVWMHVEETGVVPTEEFYVEDGGLEVPRTELVDTLETITGKIPVDVVNDVVEIAPKTGPADPTVGAVTMEPGFDGAGNLIEVSLVPKETLVTPETVVVEKEGDELDSEEDKPDAVVKVARRPGPRKTPKK